jgi:hypothetical protein
MGCARRNPSVRSPGVRPLLTSEPIERVVPAKMVEPVIGGSPIVGSRGRRIRPGPLAPSPVFRRPASARRLATGGHLFAEQIHATTGGLRVWRLRLDRQRQNRQQRRRRQPDNRSNRHGCLRLHRAARVRYQSIGTPGGGQRSHILALKQKATLRRKDAKDTQRTRGHRAFASIARTSPVLWRKSCNGKERRINQLVRLGKVDIPAQKRGHGECLTGCGGMAGH